jgi:hypothetical protein
VILVFFEDFTRQRSGEIESKPKEKRKVDCFLPSEIAMTLKGLPTTENSGKKTNAFHYTNKLNSLTDVQFVPGDPILHVEDVHSENTTNFSKQGCELDRFFFSQLLTWARFNRKTIPDEEDFLPMDGAVGNLTEACRWISQD